MKQFLVALLFILASPLFGFARWDNLGNGDLHPVTRGGSWQGGGGTLFVAGDFDGATVQLFSCSEPGGALVCREVNAPMCTLHGPGTCDFSAAPSSLRLSVTGGGAPEIDAIAPGPVRGHEENAAVEQPLTLKMAIALGLFDETVRMPGQISIERSTVVGHNPDVGIMDFESIMEQGGRAVFPSVASAWTISSSSASDTAAGIGARTVAVQAYDAVLLDLPLAVIVMDGQGGVAIPTDRLRFIRAVVVSSGSSLGNAGTIYIGSGTITAGVPDVIYGIIVPPADDTVGNEVNVSHHGPWTCPSDARCLVTSFVITCSGDCNFKFKSRSPGGVWLSASPGYAVSGIAAVSGEMSPVPGGGDFDIQVVSATGAPIAASVDIFIIVIRGYTVP